MKVKRAWRREFFPAHLKRTLYFRMKIFPSLIIYFKIDLHDIKVIFAVHRMLPSLGLRIVGHVWDVGDVGNIAVRAIPVLRLVLRTRRLLVRIVCWIHDIGEVLLDALHFYPDFLFYLDFEKICDVSAFSFLEFKFFE